MAENVKITKRDCYNTLRNLVENTMFAADAEIGADKLLEFIDHEVDLMTQRAEKSKKYQKEHKASVDELAVKIWDTVSTAEAPMAVADIVKAIDGATPQKVVYRLAQYCDAGKIQKDTQTLKGDNGTKRVTYYSVVAE